MSETKDPGRTRRRASRTAGPPPAEIDATEKLATGTAEPATTAQTVGADRPVGTAKAEAVSAKTVRTDAATEKVSSTGKPVPEAATEKHETGKAAESAIAVSSGGEGSSAETVQLEKGDAAGKAAEDADPDEPETTGTRAGRSWKRVVAVAAAAVLVIGLVGAAVVSVLAVQSTQHRDERRSEYVATARQTVLNLTTIRADTAKEDIDRILTMASGDFKTEFDGRVDPFTEIVKQAKVVSTGEVVEAAVERDDEKSAVILVAAKQTLTNAGSQEQQQRFYRFRVTVQRADDGTLTASDVKFVA